MDEPAFAVPGFQLQQQLGRGGFGVVYLATADRLDRPLALKVLHRVLDDEAVHRVAAEVQVMGTLAWHPAIVAIIETAGTWLGISCTMPRIIGQARSSNGSAAARSSLAKNTVASS